METKPGVKTSEFYVGLFGAILPVINATFGLGLPVEAVVSTVATVISYILGRSWVKKK